jgi:hypothetical protein
MTLRVAVWRAVSSKRQAVKISLSDQERLAREWAANNDGEVVAVLTVPGHSRREADVLDLFADYTAHNITAYHDLRNLWKTHGFDVLHAYDDSRFGRSATVATYVMENTLLSGASIYYHEGGWLKQEGGFRYRIAVGSATSAGDVDKMVERSKMGKMDRARRGLINGSSPPLSHVVIRDLNNGRAIRVEVNEERRRMWDDLAELLLQGIAWEFLGEELFKRGHSNKRGLPFASASLYKLVLSPVFWGNQALLHVDPDHKRRNERGLWAFDQNAPHPPNADIFYDTHPAVYTGEQAENIKRELRRRTLVIKGKARPGHTRMFTGLVVCGGCWHTMQGLVTDNNYRGLRCGSRWERRGAQDCPNTKGVSVKRVQEYFHVRIAQLLAGEPVTEFPDFNLDIEVKRQLESLTLDIEQMNERVRNAMNEQLTATSKDLQDDYREQARIHDAARAALKARLNDLQWEYEEQQHYLVDANKALEDIRRVGVADFWTQETYWINQTLFNLMCNRQIVCFDGELKGTRTRRTWNRRPSV